MLYIISDELLYLNYCNIVTPSLLEQTEYFIRKIMYREKPYVYHVCYTILFT